MNLLILSEFFPLSEDEITGGIESHAYNLLLHLQKSHTITVLTSRRPGQARSAQSGAVCVRRCGLAYSYSNSGYLLRRLSFALSAFFVGLRSSAQIVHAFSFLTYLPAALIGVCARIPYVATYHECWIGTWTKYKGHTGYFGELWERFALAFPWRRIITVSHNTKKQLLRHTNVPVTVIHNGANLTHCKSIPQNRRAGICYVGRLTKDKRVDVLLRACKDLHKNVTIVGQGPEEQTLRQLATNLGVRVTWLGFQKNRIAVLDTIRQAQVFCHPSELEGFGIVLIEAMACGTPVVCSDIPQFQEVAGNCALFFRKGSVRHLKEQLNKILKRPQVWKKYHTRGLLRSREFLWPEKAKQIATVYTDVLKKTTQTRS